MRFAEQFDKLHHNISHILVGKPEVIRDALLCLFAGGHLLLEDVPGVGKTSLARAIAASLDASWHRIQFTPDLLPSDVTGVTIFHQGKQQFEFHPGAIFANIVIADEVNRASPKTQSALLEVMEEQRVSVDSKTYSVPTPFMVVATQNPIEMDGTYRLPEAQLDRFLMRTSIGYPSLKAEAAVLQGRHLSNDIDSLRPVLSVDEVRILINKAAGVFAAPAIIDYIVKLAHATRSSPQLSLGASPRASIGLLKVARVSAAANGRDFVTPDDIQPLVAPVFSHRVVLSNVAIQRRASIPEVLTQIVASVDVPRSASA